MKYLEPITDRAALDIANRTAKAFFNASDWERIYGNAEYINVMIETLINVTTPFTTVTHPTMNSIPTVTDFNTLLENLNLMRISAGLASVTELAALKADWAAGANEDAPDYLDVNEWEEFIQIIMRLLGTIVSYQIYCGVGAVGQPRFYQHRWRVYPFVQNDPSPTRKARCGIATCGAGLKRNNKYRRYA